jgi:hypothetical protein
MIVKETTQDVIEHNSAICKNSCQKYLKIHSAYGGAYGITAQKCRSAYEGAYEHMPKCLRRCLHYYIGTISNTIVGTLNRIYIELERLCRTLGIFHSFFICKEGRK